MTIAALAVPASFGLKCVIEAELQQGVFVGIGLEIDIAAIAAVTTTGTAAGNELFPPEGDASMAPVTGFYSDSGFVDKHRGKTIGGVPDVRVSCVAGLAAVPSTILQVGC
jgi:hypothetical protein